jgi:Tol biopolymer transport system component
MPLATGARIGGYEIVTLLGAGGMGEVYRARDARLGRDVAIKIISPAIAADADGLMRFEREARVLASLNHPNIAAIYDVEDSGGTPALILELVDGETLADRIAAGPIPVAEALTYAQHIAHALDAAHERGVVHRDLKPANIKISETGGVKVLDFGLAKAIAAASAPDPAADPAQSPTITIKGTRDNVILGTAAYMSPEQARGKAIDKRTDIWAFGCVLYEMLTGRRTFGGETTSDVIAAIIEREPDMSQLPHAVPPHVRRVIARCLEKDPKRRLRDIGDVRIELGDPMPTSVEVRSRRWLVVIGAAALAAILTFAALTAWRRAAAPPARTVALTLLAEPGTTLVAGVASAAPSPDGSRVAFVARDRTTQEEAIWVRALSAPTATRLAGSEGATGEVFWSPDGRDIGFVANGRLKRIAATGGPVTSLAAITGGNLGATWNRDGVIVFALANRTPLYRVAASGGPATQVTTLDAQRENSHRWPHFLPDGDHFLFTARSDKRENNLVYVGSLSSKTITPLLAAQSDAVYAAPGYLLFVDNGALMAQRFDPVALKLSGSAAVVVSPVRHSTTSSNGFLSVSADGAVIVYGVGASATPSHAMWFDRKGAQLATVGPPRTYAEMRLSPDGKTAVVDIPERDTGTRELWLMDTTTGALTRLTSNPATDWNAAWSRDGSQIAFASDRAGASSVFRKPVDGSGDDVQVYRGPVGVFPSHWSRDGRTVLANEDRETGGAILALSVADGTATPILESKQYEVMRAAYSPDDRWIAYESLETGELEVYVSPVGRPGRIRVSVAGGSGARWRADGRELFYLSPSGDVMAAPVVAGDPLRVLPPVKLFTSCQSTTPPTFFTGSLDLNATADGMRFLVRCSLQDNAFAAFGVMLNWSLALR